MGHTEHEEYELGRINIATGKEEVLFPIEKAAKQKIWDFGAIGCYNGHILCYDIDDYRLSSLDLKTGVLSQYPFEFMTDEPGTIVITQDAFYFSVDADNGYELCKYSVDTDITETIASLPNFFYICHAGTCLLLEDNCSNNYLIDLNDPDYHLVELNSQF